MKYPSYRRFLKKFYLMRKLARRYSARNCYFRWQKTLSRSSPDLVRQLNEVSRKYKILIPTSVGSQIGSTHVEGMLAAALSLRQSDCEFLLCDSALPACMACEIGFIGKLTSRNAFPLSRAFCKTCFEPAYQSYIDMGLPVRRLSEFYSNHSLSQYSDITENIPVNQIPSLVHEGIAVGEHAHAGALRFFARGNLNESAIAEHILRQYLLAALLSAHAFTNLFSTHHFDCAVFNHGIYVPQGIIGDVCRKMGVRVVNWNPAYRKQCFVFSHDDTYHHTMVTEPVSQWEDMEWDDNREMQLLAYLKSRRQGANDWIWFHDRPVQDVDGALRDIGFDFDKPCVGLLTSVMWDAALHYESNAFPTMLDWIFGAIDYFSKRTELQLIIRVHPAEIQGGLPSRQRVCREIEKRYPHICNNIFIIPPESRLSTYALMEKCNAVTIYNTKTGIELAAMGIPIIVAGEAWIRNKGFSIDVSSPDSFYHVLDKLPFDHAMHTGKIKRARKYAYHFFFRRMIPLESMQPTTGNPPYRLEIDNLSGLLPGCSQGLDLICDGILSKKDFVYDSQDAPPTA